MWNEVTKAIDVVNLFSQSTLDQHYTANASTLPRLTPFRFCFQTATVARPSPPTSEDPRQMESLTSDFIILGTQIKDSIMNILKI